MNRRPILSLRELWKKASETRLEDLSADTLGSWAAAVLFALAALPVFVSITTRHGDIGAHWYRCLLILGAFAGILALIRLIGRPRPGVLPICLSLLLVWGVVSAALSADPLLGFFGDDYRHEGAMTYFLYAAVFAAALLPNPKQMHFVCEALAGCCAMTGILVIWGKNPLFYLEDDLRAAMFHHYNHYGYFLAICLPLCFGLALADEKPRLWHLAEFWLICNAAAFNSVRGSFLAICAMLVLWNLIVLWRHRRKWKRLLTLDLIFIATILFLNTGSTLLSRMDTLVQQLETVQQSPGDTAALDSIGSNRGIQWRLGIQYALEKPLFGWGPENLGTLYRRVSLDLSDRPHNELIQIAATMGLPALGFYLTGLGSLLVSFLRRIKELSIAQLAVFAAVGGYLVSSLFGNSMYYTTPYFYILLAFAWNISQKCCHNNVFMV